MRGPLLAGALASPATLAAVSRWLRDRAPTVVFGPPWLAVTLASEFPVLAVVEPSEPRAADKARRRSEREHPARLQFIVGGADLPLRPGACGSLLVVGLSALEHAECADRVGHLARALREGGRLCALDATRDPEAEARIAGVFLAAGLRDLGQEDPREGVVVTSGCAPAAAVTRAIFPPCITV